MRRIATFCLALSLLGTLPAFAQTPNSKAEAEWQHYLSKHPGLSEHPEWLSNQTYLKSHPNMTKWLQQHPNVFRQARAQGMWDHSGAWHDSSWWHQNHPDSMYKYHPEWAQNHPDWRPGDPDGDGDVDHPGHWHHPHHWWAKHHPGWEGHPGHGWKSQDHDGDGD